VGRDKFVAPSMKTDLDHLPLAKREPIQRVVEIVRDGAAVEMVVLFGSYARGDWVDDPVNAYFSDYDFLAVVATEELAEDLTLWDRLTTDAQADRPLPGLADRPRRQGILLHDTGPSPWASPRP
jgi:predicted nucleotidyltransferase